MSSPSPMQTANECAMPSGRAAPLFVMMTPGKGITNIVAPECAGRWPGQHWADVGAGRMGLSQPGSWPGPGSVTPIAIRPGGYLEGRRDEQAEPTTRRPAGLSRAGANLAAATAGERCYPRAAAHAAAVPPGRQT